MLAADEPAAEEAPADEPAAEPVVEEEPAAEPVAEALPTSRPTSLPRRRPAEAEEPVAADAAAEEARRRGACRGSARGRGGRPAPQSGPKLKKKRLPRSQRPVKTRPRRDKPTERKPIVRLEKPEHDRGRSQERQGTVVSDAMDKTIVVKVDTIKAHPRYKKVVRRSAKFHAHDEQNQAKAGDIVRIVETRPLSKTKRWRLAEIVEAAK